MDEMTDEELLTFEDALQALGTSRATLYRLLSQGDVKGLKVGKQWRFRRADLQAYMERGPVEISAAPAADMDAELAAFDSPAAADPLLTSTDKALELVRRILETAVDRRASDIHMEATTSDGEMCFLVRYRIDGVLTEIRRMPISLQDMLTAQVKTMADMNVSEKRIPQDGHIRMSRNGREFDICVATGATFLGEALVMRILDRSVLLVGLDKVGPSGETLSRLRELIRQPTGMILFTGPTGSGKTTTMYSCLGELAGPQVKSMTIEDPVGFTLPYVTSFSTNTRLGFTFPAAIHSFMRQDPDIIVVGECRDRETIEMAVEATLVGHLVLTQILTNDATGAIIRLLDMGIEPYLLAAAITGIVAQRLCRKICVDCKEAYEVPAATLERFGWTLEKPDDMVTLYRGKGCVKCQHKGFRGRIAIFELLVMNEKIADLIVHRAPASEIRKAARESGMHDVREDGLSKVLAGITTPDEVMRVTFTAGY